jgi:hypothetical protein
MKHRHNQDSECCEQCLIPDLLAYIPDDEHTKPLKQILRYSLFTFSRRAKKYMIWYYVMKFVSFVAPLTITAITSLTVENSKYYIVFLSLLASLAVGIAGIGLFHDNWIRYRDTCEQLKSEVIQFVSDTGDYDEKSSDEKVDLLGKRVTSILKSETQEWKKEASVESSFGKASSFELLSKKIANMNIANNTLSETKK